MASRGCHFACERADSIDDEVRSSIRKQRVCSRYARRRNPHGVRSPHPLCSSWVRTRRRNNRKSARFCVSKDFPYLNVKADAHALERRELKVLLAVLYRPIVGAMHSYLVCKALLRVLACLTPLP